MSAQPPPVLAHLGHPLRWRLLRALAERDRSLAELTELLGLPPSITAQELSALCEAHLVGHHVPDDGSRLATYALDRTELDTQSTVALAAFYPDFDTEAVQRIEDELALHPRVRVLFLCMYNAASSQMAEGILHHLGGGRVAVYSAASAPTALHPLAVRTMAGLGIDIADQRPKHLGLYRGMRFDYVITLCDCRREPCPTYVGGAERLLWPVADPSLGVGSEEQRQEAFVRTADELMGRVRAFLSVLHAQGKGQR